MTAVGSLTVDRRSGLLALLTLAAIAAALLQALPRSAPSTHSRPGWTALPAAAQVAVSRGLGAHNSAFRVGHGIDGALSARNGRLRSRFTTSGVEIATKPSARASLRLGLAALGRGDALHATAPTMPVAQDNLVTYLHSGVREWYANGPAGIEQGFTLTHRPSGSGALTLAVGRLSGTSRARVDARGTTLTVDGLRYGQLIVADARGRIIPARIALSDGWVLLRVDDARALYPLMVDPLAQLSELGGSTSTAPGSDYQVGYSVSMSADATTIVASSVWHTPFYVVSWVFVEPPHGWATEPAATESGTLGQRSFQHPYIGYYDAAISADGRTIALGTTTDTGEGGVDVYVEPPGGWTELGNTSAVPSAAELSATDPEPHDELGWWVGISADGRTITAGDPHHERDQGAVYVFSEPPGGWAAAAGPTANQTAEFTASDGASGDRLGTSAGITSDGSVITAGAPGHNGGRGAVYVFKPPTSPLNSAIPVTGHQVAELGAADGAAGDALGAALAMSADGRTIAAGAPNHGGGVVYMYGEPQHGWAAVAPAAKLTASDASAGAALGSAVALDAKADTLVAGAPFADANHGASYVFSRPAGGWSAATGSAANQSDELTASDGASGDELGHAVTIAGNGGIVASSATGHGTGRIYVFGPRSAGGTSTVGGSSGGGSSGGGSPTPTLPGQSASQSRVFLDALSRANVHLRRGSFKLEEANFNAFATTFAFNVTLGPMSPLRRASRPQRKARSFALKSMTVTLVPGQAETITIRLTRAAKHFLDTHQGKRVKVQIVVVESDGFGDRQTFKYSFAARVGRQPRKR